MDTVVHFNSLIISLITFLFVLLGWTGEVNGAAVFIISYFRSL